VAEARGLYQIWPATGRLLARVLGREYSDEMLYDPATNTDMAALYLDILSSTYHDERMVLAEYNGGPINAGYLRARSVRVATETSDYVDKVIAIHEELERKLEFGIDAASRDVLYRALDRDEKALIATGYRGGS
jgi:soluble lytic murein transglycosylase-like protein